MVGAVAPSRSGMDVSRSLWERDTKRPFMFTKKQRQRRDIIGFFGKWMIMEAEQLNSLSNLLDDLAARAAQLRRYL
jgi:hypothetical protein